MLYNRYELLILFFIYAFAGWCGETAAASLIGRKFRNRGFVSSPFCLMYGFMGVAVTIVFKDLRRSVVLLFLGCSILCALIQWITGQVLERIGSGRWWDYTGLPLNINGYVAVPVSAGLGGIGTMIILFFNDALIGVYRLLPFTVQTAIVWVLSGIASFDLLVSFLGMLRIEGKFGLKRWNRRLQSASNNLADRIAVMTRKRVWNAYPGIEKARKQKNSGAFAKDDSFSQLEIFWLCLIGALAGDGVETLFMWLTRRVWMSRSSLVWGTFSVVWGLAIGVFSSLLYRDRKRSDGYLFLVGTLIGGTYEYLCSVFTELVFGAVFWDYSHLPFNIGGRVNLLYCFFWGIAAVLWIKHALPFIHRLLKVFLKWEKRLISLFAVIFIVMDMIMSCGALIRYDERSRNASANNSVARYFDDIYGDEVMERKYPGLKRRSRGAVAAAGENTAEAEAAGDHTDE